MAVAPPPQIIQARRAYDALLEAQAILEEQGQIDIAVLLFHALGLIEERFGFVSPDHAAALDIGEDEGNMTR